MTEIEPTALLDLAVIDEPHAFYERLLADAPVWAVGETGVFTVSSYELVAEATSRVEDFSSSINCLLYRDEHGLPARLSYGDGGVEVLATADPPLHPVHRATVFPELVAKRMADLEEEITALAERCITAGVRAGTFDLTSVIANVVPITIINRLIGFRDSDIHQLFEAAIDSTAMLGSTLSLDELMSCITRTGEIQTWITGQLDAAKRAPGQDLLGAVARGVNDGVFGDFDAVVILHTLLSAGGESTTSLLGNAVRLLAEDQELQTHLRANHERIPLFIEEALRLEPPFRYHMRSVPNDTSLGSVDIPAGSTVLLLWGAANRDPAEFPRPGTVDLDRPLPRRHLAFGRGIHHCVGAPLARLEAACVLTGLLEQTSDLSLDPDRKPVWANSLMVRRHDELPVRVAGTRARTP